MLFDITEQLRNELETARAQHSYVTAMSKQAGQTTEGYVTLGKRAEYLRGRADGLRLALDVIAKDMLSVDEAPHIRRLRRIFA